MNHKEGMIYKLSGVFFKTWEQRWVIIHNNTLEYFRNQEEALSSPNNPRDFFDMRGSSATIVEVDRAPTPYCIELILKRGPEEHLFFSLPTEVELNEWLDCFKKGSIKIDPNNVPQTSDSTVTAYQARLLFSQLSPLPEDLKDSSQILYKKAYLGVKNEEGTVEARTVILLSSVLLITEAKSTRLLLKVYISLHTNPQVENGKSDAEFLIITHTNKKYSFFTNGKNTRDAWYSAIRDRIQASTSNKATTIEDSSNNTNIVHSRPTEFYGGVSVDDL